MVYGRYNELVNGDHFMVYKPPKHNWGAPSCRKWSPILFGGEKKPLKTGSNSAGHVQTWKRNKWKPWVNYNELTTSSLEIIVSKGNHPQMALIQVSELL